MTNNDNTTTYIQQIKSAIQAKSSLCIKGSNSKHFLGRKHNCQEILNTSDHTGIVYYEPTELVLRVRSGTRIAEIEQTLAQHKQCLSFNPPKFGPDTTIGGAIASGLCGPNLPYWGSVQDAVLGLQLINGEGTLLNFGGQVIKNVAGYDISRFIVGSMGTLGLISEVAIKVIPQPAEMITLRYQLDEQQAIKVLYEYKHAALPLSASAYVDSYLYLQFAGSKAAINTVTSMLGKDWQTVEQQFWQQLRDHQLDFFQQNKTLWRITMPAGSMLTTFKDSITDAMNKTSIMEWDGMQHWIFSDMPEQEIRSIVKSHAGQAHCFRSENDLDSVFQPLPAGLQDLSFKTKLVFDPYQIFNPNRLYKDW